MIRLVDVPTKDRMDERYGNPGRGKKAAPGFEKNLKRFPIPFPMRLPWEPETQVQVILAHKDVGPAMVDALQEILDYKGYDYLRENDLDMFGGAYIHRLIRGGEDLSTHSYGISLDLNPEKGPYDPIAWRNGTYKNEQPQFIIDAFVKRGFQSLPHDRMHFQGVLE